MSTTDEQQRHREMIHMACNQYGLTPPGESDFSFDAEEHRERGALGRWRVVEDDEDRSLFADDEGELYVTVVGAQHYGNEHVAFYFKPDDFDEATDRVTPFEDVEPA